MSFWRHTPSEWDETWGRDGAPPGYSPLYFWLELAGLIFFLSLMFVIGLVGRVNSHPNLGTMLMIMAPTFASTWVGSMVKSKVKMPPRIKELNAYHAEKSTGINPLGALSQSQEHGGELALAHEGELMLAQESEDGADINQTKISEDAWGSDMQPTTKALNIG